MKFKTIRDIELNGRTVLLRADLNVPVKDGQVSEATRIERLKPTIDYLRKNGAKILVLSHFGRPKGEPDPALSLEFLVPALKKHWSADIYFAKDCIGPETQKAAADLKPGDVLLLENLRFHKGEKDNDPEFAKELAKLGDLYVNDAFSVSHRAHTSTEGLARLLPSVAGLLMEEELNALNKALGQPQKPVAAITGGSKISTKLSVLNNLVRKVDYLILGGAMANTFLFASGANIGSSMCEKEMKDEALRIMDTAKKNNCTIILPVDCVVVSDLKENAEHQIVNAQNIPDGKMAIDAGPESIKNILQQIKDCKTIVWNGPMGVFEIKPFDQGTNALARAVAEKTKQGDCISIAGGGDTIAALENAEIAENFTYISTAGGAFLEWLEGKTLPGVAALTAQDQAA